MTAGPFTCLISFASCRSCARSPAPQSFREQLFVDQDGIPTLVEVKRSSDTRLRREVVGQLLDYAANAVLYWPVEKIRAQFEQTCHSGNQDPGQVLAGLYRVSHSSRRNLLQE